jgi:hypothetical protein
MGRDNRIAALRILLATALEDARAAASEREQAWALVQAHAARRGLSKLGFPA